MSAAHQCMSSAVRRWMMPTTTTTSSESVRFVALPDPVRSFAMSAVRRQWMNEGGGPLVDEGGGSGAAVVVQLAAPPADLYRFRLEAHRYA